MNNRASQANLERKNAFFQPNALRDVSIVALPIVVLGAIGNVIGIGTLAGGATINVGYILAIILGGFILRYQGSSWHKIGLAKPASWLKSIVFGVGVSIGAVVLFVAIQLIAFSALSAFGLAPSEIDQSRFNPVEGNLYLFILMMVLAWTTIAFGEELFYRAFLITRLVDHTVMSREMAIMLSGIVFGLVHFAEGPVGILSNAAFGILFGWIYVRSGRNLWITLIGHGLLNTLRFTLLYAGAA